jgi:transposase
MVDVAAIKRRFHSLAPFLDERGRRVVLASEVAVAGKGSLKAVAAATGVARSTIGRGLGELRAGRDVLGDRVRRPGAGRKRATDKQPGLLDARCELIQSAIRGDPEAPLVWISKSPRHLSQALTERGFKASQKLVGRMLKTLGFSLQANRKTREGSRHPDRDARFDYLNARGESVSGRSATRHLGRHQAEGTGRGPSAHGLVPWGLQERRPGVAPARPARAGAGG